MVLKNTTDRQRNSVQQKIILKRLHSRFQAVLQRHSNKNNTALEKTVIYINRIKQETKHEYPKL